MKHEDIHTLYFLGIGGIGMSALARYFAHEGYCILGHDRTSTPLTKQLETEGMDIRYDACLDDVLSLDPAHTLVVRTPAVPEDDVRLAHFRQHGFAIAEHSVHADVHVHLPVFDAEDVDAVFSADIQHCLLTALLPQKQASRVSP